MRLATATFHEPAANSGATLSPATAADGALDARLEFHVCGSQTACPLAKAVD